MASRPTSASMLRKLENLVGRRVDAYFDGKASPTRLVSVVVDNVGTREDLSRHERKLWRDALKKDFDSVFNGCVHYVLDGANDTKQFWDWNCDVFIGGHILYDDVTIRDPMLFARRPAGFGWYCVNWNYSLDITGRIRKRMLGTWRTGADYGMLRMEWDRDAGKYKFYDKKTGELVKI